MTGAICGGGEWGRGVFYCPVCGGRRRGLDRLVFGGYGSDHVCGGCGTWWSAGEIARSTKQQAKRSKELVKAQWPKSRDWRTVSREALR
jgi:hypothetical protein